MKSLSSLSQNISSGNGHRTFKRLNDTNSAQEAGSFSGHLQHSFKSGFEDGLRPAALIY